ncbi:MAG: hypothetical protein KF752_11370 [Pirellulaceae bacterium]|nr:hypothetical protein [Pirellulaceae bacterium]
MRSLQLSVTLLLSLSAAQVSGQGTALTELYGEGVHRYFARDYLGAEELLTRAIEGGSQDPRTYFFRGLVHAAIGNDGRADFQEGARMEAFGRSGINVSLALSRIQGYYRTEIEKARRDARIEALRQRELMQQSLPTGPVVPMLPTPSPMIPPAQTDPFRGEDGLRSKEIDAIPPVAVTPPEDAREGVQADTLTDDSDPLNSQSDEATDPFEDEKESAPSTNDDPFQESDLMEDLKDTDAQQPPADSDDDPFADPSF